MLKRSSNQELCYKIAVVWPFGLIPKIGFLPYMPGTWGSIPAFFTVLIFHLFLPVSFFQEFQTGGIIISLVIGLLVIPNAVRKISIEEGGKEFRFDKETEFDFHKIVIDEVRGVFVACSTVFLFAMPWWWLIVAFALFRIFDIKKPWLIR